MKKGNPVVKLMAMKSDQPKLVSDLVRRLLAALGIGQPKPKSSVTLHFDDHGRLAGSEQRIVKKHPLQSKN